MPASRRLPSNLAPNPWAERVAERRAAGRDLLDLTASNPTRVGLSGVTPELLAKLSDPRGVEDRPDPRGLASAREAVAAYYTARGTPIDAGDVVLTAGTSESYAHLFRLLTDPGDAVLVPSPSYPLVEPIAELEGVEAIRYRLAWDGAWHLDLASLDEALEVAGARARVAVVVEPNHPTGTCLTMPERDALERRLEERGMALISDEVFADFPWPPRTTPFPGWLGPRRVPTFALGGLSKCCGMPQLKLGWIIASGPDTGRWLEGLEWIADLFLSVATPVQLASPALLEARHSYQARVRERLTINLATLAELVGGQPETSVLAGEGGWGAVLRLPAREVDWSLTLLERDVIVHPGHFYELESEGCVVLSLICEVATFRAGLGRVAEALTTS